MDLNRGLVISSSGEYLGLLDRDGGIALDDSGEYAAQGFNTQGQRSNIQQQQVLDFAAQYAALNGSAHGNALIGVDALEGLFADVAS